MQRFIVVMIGWKEKCHSENTHMKATAIKKHPFDQMCLKHKTVELHGAFLFSWIWYSYLFAFYGGFLAVFIVPRVHLVLFA